jgi:hypothetical protein
LPKQTDEAVDALKQATIAADERAKKLDERADDVERRLARAV